MSSTTVRNSNWRLVEVGRVVLVKKGQSAGKLAAIVEIIDQKQVLIDGPETGVPRQSINLGQVVLTPLTFTLPRGARTSIVSRSGLPLKLLNPGRLPPGLRRLLNVRDVLLCPTSKDSKLWF